MKINYDHSNFSSHEECAFFDKLIELIAENFALRQFTSFEKLPLGVFGCQINELKSNNLSRRYFHFKKPELNKLIAICSKVLNRISKKYSVEDFIKQFYFHKMCKIFKIYDDCLNLEFDENGLPAETSLSLRNYIVKLYPTFCCITKLKVKTNYVAELPTELLYKAINSAQWILPNALESIILGKFHKGINLFSFFLYKVPESKRITQSLLINKSFLRLCHAEWDNLILLNDDINSIDFQLAVLDLISFKDNKNKLLFDNKVMQFRHEYAAKTVANAFLSEFEKLKR